MKHYPLVIVSLISLCAVTYSCTLMNRINQLEKNGYICNNYSNEPVNQMDKNEVLGMIRNYYNNQYAAIHSTNNPNNAPLVKFPSNNISTNKDGRCVFFDLQTLKRLLYYIEKSAQGFSTSDKNNLGINIYYASYPRDKEMVINGFNYTNRHTLVMIPAIFDASQKMAKDINICGNLTTASANPQFITKNFINDNTKISICGYAPGLGYKSTSPDDNMGSQNHGSITPPPFNSSNLTGNPILDATSQ